MNGGSLFTESRNINIDDVITTSRAEANGLICRSDSKTTSTSPLGFGNWYLHAEQETTASMYKIGSSGDRGWWRTNSTNTNNFRRVFLRRQPAPETALEGKFTCKIHEDTDPVRSLFVLYPSESYNTNHTRLHHVAFTLSLLSDCQYYGGLSKR